MHAQVPRAQPQAEQDWQYSAALTATSAIKLSSHTEILPLPRVVRDHLPPDSPLQHICWSERVLCTANFVRTISAAKSPALIHEYLRPLGMVLLFPADGTVLLVSEREANALLLLLYMQGGASSGGCAEAQAPVLQPFCYARLAHYSEGSMQLLAAGHSFPKAVTQVGSIIVDMQLFNGDTAYGDESSNSSSSKEARLLLRGLVNGKNRAAEDIVGMRGKMPMFPRSDLEWACRIE